MSTDPTGGFFRQQAERQEGILTTESLMRMLQEVYPQDLLREELARQHAFLDAIPREDPWRGASVHVPYSFAGPVNFEEGMRVEVSDSGSAPSPAQWVVEEIENGTITLGARAPRPPLQVDAAKVEQFNNEMDEAMRGLA